MNSKSYSAGNAGRPSRTDITGVILAGGRGRRMGGVDKGLAHFAGRPFVEHAISALRPQVGRLVISANRNLARYREYGFPVISDSLSGFRGPLAGILAAMEAAKTAYLLTVPCDTLTVPSDLASRLSTALTGNKATIGIVHDGTRLQPLFALLCCSLAADLRAYLEAGGGEVTAWMTGQQPALADFSDKPGAFRNLNTLTDLRRLEQAGWKSTPG